MRYLSASLLLFLLASASWAEDYEYKEYIVIKGDTLWDIASREINNPFQWPLIWKENAKIKDPDRIYPAQSIMIPIGIRQKEEKALESVEIAETVELQKAEEPIETEIIEVPIKTEQKEIKKADLKPEAKRITPVKKDYLVDMGTLLLAGYITMTPPRKGEIIDSPRGGKTFSALDDVYLKTTGDVKKGDMFYITRNRGEVKHPKTGLLLGYLIEISGRLRVEEISLDGIRAKILDSVRDISIGDTLDDYYDTELPYVLDEPRKPEIEGFIVATNEMRTLSSHLNVVHIDKGKNDGLEPGDVLVTIFPGSKARQNAVIQIINIRDSTSTAVILKSILEVTIGDAVTGMK